MSPGRSGGAVLRLLLPGTLLLQTLLFLVPFLGRDGALLDDAYISFRYAARWAAGLGPTWNDGVPVEGFSNPLWTLVLAGLARIGPPPHVVAPWLGFACFLGLTGVLGGLGRVRRFSAAALAILVLGPGLDAGLAVWAGSGLETVSATLLVAAWLLAAATLSPGVSGLGRGLLLGVLGAGLALSRPEGILWALWGLAWLIWGTWASPRSLVGWVLGFVPALLYTVYRWAVFGRLVPNTFYAKVEPGPGGVPHGLEDVAAWTVSHGGAILVLGLVLAGFRRGRRDPRRPAPPRWALLSGGWVGLQAMLVVAAGGDWMGHARYLAPVLPCAYLLLAEGWDRAVRVSSRRTAAALLGTFGVIHLALGWQTRDVIPDYTRVGRVVGEWLEATAAPGDTLAVSAAGAIPYFSGLPTLDVLGINDPSVAGRKPRHLGAWAPGHHRYDIASMMELRPTWIVWDFSVAVNEHRMRRYRGQTDRLEALDYRRALFAYPGFGRLYRIHPNTPPRTRGTYTVFHRR